MLFNLKFVWFINPPSLKLWGMKGNRKCRKKAFLAENRAKINKNDPKSGDFWPFFKTSFNDGWIIL